MLGGWAWESLGSAASPDRLRKRGADASERTVILLLIVARARVGIGLGIGAGIGLGLGMGFVTTRDVGGCAGTARVCWWGRGESKETHHVHAQKPRPHPHPHPH